MALAQRAKIKKRKSFVQNPIALNIETRLRINLAAVESEDNKPKVAVENLLQALDLSDLVLQFCVRSADDKSMLTYAVDHETRSLLDK